MISKWIIILFFLLLNYSKLLFPQYLFNVNDLFTIPFDSHIFSNHGVINFLKYLNPNILFAALAIIKSLLLLMCYNIGFKLYGERYAIYFASLILSLFIVFDSFFNLYYLLMEAFFFVSVYQIYLSINNTEENILIAKNWFFSGLFLP